MGMHLQTVNLYGTPANLLQKSCPKGRILPMQSRTDTVSYNFIPGKAQLVPKDDQREKNFPSNRRLSIAGNWEAIRMSVLRRQGCGKAVQDFVRQCQA